MALENSTSTGVMVCEAHYHLGEVITYAARLTRPPPPSPLSLSHARALVFFLPLSYWSAASSLPKFLSLHLFLSLSLLLTDTVKLNTNRQGPYIGELGFA